MLRASLINKSVKQLLLLVVMVSMMIVNTDSFYPLSLVAVGVCDEGGILFINSLQLVLMAVMAMMVVNTRASPFDLFFLMTIDLKRSIDRR